MISMSFSKNNKYIFGSAGLGMPEYGFSSSNKPSLASSYLKYIYNVGVRHIDTAPSYGYSEKTIGKFHQNSVQKFGMWTKVDGLETNSHYTKDRVIQSLKESIKKLNVDYVECLYLHQNDVNIIEDKFVQKALKEIKLSGLAKKVGVSIYNSLELKSSLSLKVYDVIQLPVSVVNTHLYNIANIHNSKKTLVARSIFLQGSLLNVDSKKKYFNYYNDISKMVGFLKELAYSYKIDYLGMLLSYINSLDGLDHIIVSSKNKRNIDEILKKSDLRLCDNMKSKLNEISKKQNDWTNPRNWLF